MARLDPPPPFPPPKPQAPSSVDDIWLCYSIILIYPISNEYYHIIIVSTFVKRALGLKHDYYFGKILLRQIRLTVIVFRIPSSHDRTSWVVKKMSTKTCGVLIKIIFTLFIFSDVHCKILNPVILGKSSYREIMYIYLYLSQIYK